MTKNIYTRQHRRGLGDSAEHSAGTAADFDATVRARSATLASAPLPPVFRDALREHLHQTVTTTAPDVGTAGASRAAHPPRTSRRWPRSRTSTLGVVLAAGLVGGGVAVATGVLPLPGADQVVLRTPASTVVHTGTATVDLGARPAGTTSVELTLTCLSPGTLTFDDGATMSCGPQDLAADGSLASTSGPAPTHGSAGYTLPLPTGQTSTTITATAQTRWSLTSVYSTRTPTDWAVNGNGQTYGVTRDDGSNPDLIAVAVSTGTGEQGYVRDTDLNDQPQFTSPAEALAWQDSHPAPRSIPVYASDGVTVLGEFQVG